MTNNKNIKIGITGGTGFVGSYAIRELLENGYHNITAIKREESRKDLLHDIDDQIHWVSGDILDVPSLENAFHDVDILIHAAAMVSFHGSDRSEMKRVNIEGTRNIVNLAIDFPVKKLIHLSSVAAIGRSKQFSEISEDSKWEEDDLNSPYAISKRQSELEAWRAYAEGLPTIILNPTVILGAAFWDSGSAALIPRIINGVPFYPAGKTGFVDVRDVAKAIRIALGSEFSGERFILNAANMSYREFFTKVCNEAGCNPPSSSIPSWSHSLFSNLAKISAFIAGKKPIITKSTLSISSLKFSYNGKKSQEKLGLTYRPIDQTIRETTRQYLADQKKNKDHSILSLAH